jgi:cytoskeletal protein CcmA (bactofilin family)
VVASTAGAASIWSELPLDWINPFHPSGRLTWLFTGTSLGLSVLQNGAVLATMAGAVGHAAAALLLMLVVLAGTRASRRVAVTGLLAALFAAAAAAPAEAVVVRQATGDVVVRSAETVDDTLLAGGERIVIEGTVTGDVIAGGGRVEIRGTVHGNLLVWAQYVEVDGEVGGSVFASGQDVTVRGSVGGSLYAFGQYVRVLDGGRIAGSVVSSSQGLTIGGAVDRGVLAGVYRLEVDGEVRRDVVAQAGRISVGPDARIGGTLTARVSDPDDLRVDAAATLGAQPVVRSRSGERSPSRYLTASFYVWQAVWLLAAFLTGWLLLWVAPGAVEVELETPATALRTLGIGFLCVVATPVAAIVAGLTLVGLPVALVAVALWMLGIYLAKIPMAVFLGRTILGPRGSGGGPPLALLVGLLAVFVAVNLPFVGWVVNLALTLIGVGWLFAWALSASRSRSAVPART